MPVHRLDRFVDDDGAPPASPPVPSEFAGALRQIALGLRIIAVAAGLAAVATLGHVVLLCR